jgi:hypothetical protein
VTRNDPQYAPTVRVLDQLLSLAQRNRTQLVIPRLQPVVKWTGVNPSVTWDDLDTLISPWLNGDAFADRTPLGYWPLPAPEHLDSYDLKSRLAYWTSAASHFAQNQWLNQSPVFHGEGVGRPRGVAGEHSGCRSTRPRSSASILRSG